MNEFNLAPPGESTDASQSLNIVAAPLIPQDCHLFLRTEPQENTVEFTSNLHRHYMLVCCMSGRGCWAVDNTPYVLAQNEAMLIVPGQLHSRLPLDGQKVQWLIIRFSLEKESEWLNLTRNQIFSFAPEKRRLLTEFCQAFHSYRAGEEASASECILRLALLLNTFRSISGRDDPMAPELPPAVKRLCRLLVSAQGSNKTFAEIAREQGVSSGHLRMLFKQVTGKTPSYARNAERCRRAEHLLVHSHLNVSEIAQKLGFGSIYAFSRFFKKCKGISPLQFRSRNRKV